MIKCRGKIKSLKEGDVFAGRKLADRKLLTDAPWYHDVSLIHQLLLEFIRPIG